MVNVWSLGKFDITESLKVPKIRRVLPRYVKIVTNDLPAKFQIAKRIVFDFHGSMSTGEMWEEHDRLVQKLRHTQQMIDKDKLNLEELEIPRFSLLDLKTMLAKEILRSCELCERKCHVNRLEGEAGFCNVGTEMKICSIFTHMSEEPFISPSLACFFSRCTWRCVYCQNWEISQGTDEGVIMSPRRLAVVVESYVKGGGVRNLNLVGGECTPYLEKILETLKLCKINTPIVWNSNGYCSEKTMKLLNGIIDLFLFDFRYFDDNCALRLSKAQNCREVLTRNHLLAKEHAESVIRILVLPNHLECCAKPMLKWIKENLGNKVLINLMDQYYPTFKSYEHLDINRRLYPEEFEEVVAYAKKLKLSFIT